MAWCRRNCHGTSDNAVDTLRKDVDGLNLTTLVLPYPLSVVVRECFDTIVANKNATRYVQLSLRAAAQHHRQIDENTATILSVRRLAQTMRHDRRHWTEACFRDSNWPSTYQRFVRTWMPFFMQRTTVSRQEREIKLNAANRYVVTLLQHF